jgi:hypothetical protein
MRRRARQIKWRRSPLRCERCWAPKTGATQWGGGFAIVRERFTWRALALRYLQIYASSV